MQTSADIDRFFSISDPWGYEKDPDDARRVREVLAVLPDIPFARVLDIGCGSGYLTLRLPGREVVGIDLSPKAIAWAKERLARDGHRPVTFEVRSIFDLDGLPAESFDLIVVTGVLYQQYIGQAFTTLSASISRLLTPGGHLVQVHIKEWFKNAFPMSLIEKKIYPYRDYTHILELYRQ